MKIAKNEVKHRADLNSYDGFGAVLGGGSLYPGPREGNLAVFYKFRNQRQQIPLIAGGRQKRGFADLTSSDELGASTWTR
jgi:hypothetical protein